MDYDDEDEVAEREVTPAFEDDDDEDRPAKRPKKTEEDDDEFVNEKRGYTAQEKNMIEEWLKNHRPKSDKKDEKDEHAE